MLTINLQLLKSAIKVHSVKCTKYVVCLQIDILMGIKDKWGMFRLMFLIAFPKMAKYLDIAFINPEATEFIVQIIRC